MSSNLENFLAANESYVANFKDGGKPLPPALKTAIVACMDARIDVAAALGLKIGDSHVIRNAGGIGADAIRSLVISQQLLGTTEIYILKHTHCGMLGFTNPDIHGVIKENLGVTTDVDFLPYPDLEKASVEDIEFIKSSPLIKPGTVITAFIYDVDTGKVKVVASDEKK